jgi:hypothetical protein
MAVATWRQQIRRKNRYCSRCPLAKGYPRGSGSGHTTVRKATWRPPVLDRRAATPRAALWRSTFPLFQPPPTPKPPSLPSWRAGGWRSEATHMRLIDERVAALEAAAQPCEFTSYRTAPSVQDKRMNSY